MIYSPVVNLLIVLLIVWMLACVWCGYSRRFILFAALLLGALAANTLWMVVGLETNPVSRHALMAHLAAVMYACSSLLLGWIIGRFIRSWRESRVLDSEAAISE